MPDYLTLVREYFPDASDDEALDILWNYTGYPGFWTGKDPDSACRAQLQHLKEVGRAQVDAELDAAADELMPLPRAA